MIPQYYGSIVSVLIIGIGLFFLSVKNGVCRRVTESAVWSI